MKKPRHRCVHDGLRAACAKRGLLVKPYRGRMDNEDRKRLRHIIGTSRLLLLGLTET